MARIMVVDDDQDLAEMLGIVLTSSGFDVDLVNRGDEALEAFRNNPPDLVLLDCSYKFRFRCRSRQSR